ncbi:hypothetical protein GDO81_022303 [Engystomops pustulosus]|uniref:Reverse transcriptase domain-containing protein n=1 Tax=Engystomops pustulosus TaxID=76066 RepID=A0AAV6Z4L3_ENGPU|nr:hypothetical protein GDO81_022303 [Engystomops pustulosus]
MSIDVESRYTRILHETGVAAVRTVLEAANKGKESLLSVTTKCYGQKEGAAVGTPVSPPVKGIHSTYKYRRYVDDVVVIWTK